MEKKKIHLICNAHLDPVWLWEWQEGAGEAMSTFRVAAEICEKGKAFIFNHNEAILYKWVQEYEPELFARIQKLVKAGRWHIMGGWYLQPDCNMPSGESFVRQILAGRSYFLEHFGVLPTTAINFDPFGHTRGLVQILAKSGYDSYLFGRPRPHELDLEGDDFVWVGYDGSEVVATRFKGWYLSQRGQAAEEIERRIELYEDKDVGIVLWGVGNHGGGPSKKDVVDINDLIAKRHDCEIRHSTPEEYFKDITNNKGQLPRRCKDINPWATGCYTSQIRIKQKHRELENELYSLEKMASAAAVHRLMKYPQAKISEAMEDLLMGEFHDILPGSSIEPVEESSLRTLDHGLEIVSREKAKAFFALCSGQPKAKDGDIPVLVYNPHPFKVKAILDCEFHLPDMTDEYVGIEIQNNSKVIRSQVEEEMSDLPIEWRKRVSFIVELEPSQMNRFDCRAITNVTKPEPTLKAKGGKIVFKTKELEVVVNTRTGFVDRYRVRGRDCLGKKAFEPIVVKDIEDSWAMDEVKYADVVGSFKLMGRERGSAFSGLRVDEGKKISSVRVVEDGPIRSIIEAVFEYGDSAICQHYKLPKVGTEIEVETRVYWNEKTRMLKLSIPTVEADSKYIGQVAYGVADLPGEHNEAVTQKWVAVVSKKNNVALTCINNGTYGSDFSDDGLRMTLLRSAAYASEKWPTIVQDRFRPRMDQGLRIFKFWVNAGSVSKRLDCIDREALVRNEKPCIVSFFPAGTGKKPSPLAVLSDDVVQITAIKRAEKGDAFIIRLFEPTGKSRTTMLSLPFVNARIKVALSGFEIKTLRVNARTGKVVAADLLERPIR